MFVCYVNGLHGGYMLQGGSSLCVDTKAFIDPADDSAQTAAQRPAERTEEFLGTLLLLLSIILFSASVPLPFQLRLGKQRQVWFIDECGVCR